MTKSAQNRCLATFWKDIQPLMSKLTASEQSYVTGWYEQALQHVDEGAFNPSNALALRNGDWNQYNFRYGVESSVQGLKGEILAVALFREMYPHVQLAPDDKQTQLHRKIDLFFKKGHWDRWYSAQVKHRKITDGIFIRDEDTAGTADRLIFADTRIGKQSIVWVDRKLLISNLYRRTSSGIMPVELITSQRIMKGGKLSLK